MSEGRLFVVSGPSGTGKGTICRALLGAERLALSVSMTTRPARPGETDGVSYHFVSRAEFVSMIKDGEFLEYAEVYGNYYGTPKKKVLAKLKDGADVILEIDIQGAMQVKKLYQNAILIFILPPSMAELKERITGRGSETESDIKLRMGKTLEEIECIKNYDYFVVNNELEEAVARLKAIITAEHSRVAEDINTVIEKYKEEI